MSLKKYFEVAENISSLSGKTADEIASQVESVGYHEEDIKEEERFIPRVDFSKPENFARYGSAVEYYDQALKRIYNQYPYDGSLREKLEWQNESTYVDLHIFDNLYPRTNGYGIMSADGWGTVDGTLPDGYGVPSDIEYIYVKGGPNPNPNGSTPLSTQFTGSNYYEPDMNRGSNLEMDMTSQGVTVEFWLKKDAFDDSLTEKEVIFDMWNGESSLDSDYLRFRLEMSASTDGSSPFLLTVLSGTTGIDQESIAAATFTTASVADGSWHHYAVSVKTDDTGLLTRFYVDGNLNNEATLGTDTVADVSSLGLRANIGALIVGTDTDPAALGGGKLSGSIDEFRYWKTQRTSQEIGRFWFTQVGGGVNSDPTPFTTTEESANIDLGVYFKFNEGITGNTSIDSTVLDYSGRFSNGAWTGYTSNSRNTGSAIVLSNAAISEFQDPIIYSSHPQVVALAAELQTSGSAHDVNNNASVYNSIPSWITEEDSEGTNNVKYLTQIISSYFDTLHLQIDNLNSLKDIQYPSGSEKPLPFAEKLLSSYGFVAPDLFLDADVLEKLADRSEDKVYEKPLHDIKNTIYQNIYNNLNYIYKSKGTEKAFRNLIRCFGIDDELVKLNMYANDVEYVLRNNRRNVIVGDKFANFNTSNNKSATVYNYADSSNADSVGFITSSAGLTGGYATTLEAEILFPLKPDQSSRIYTDTDVISASLFGVHGASNTPDDTTWTTDEVNFQVYAARDELHSTNARFVLTSTPGGQITTITSSLYEDVYSNTRWNLSVRIRPEQFALTGLVDGTNSNYVVELHGVQAEAGEILEEFTLSQTITPPSNFVTGNKRVYVGAHRNNFTGSVLETSDVKVNACRYWLDYLDDETLSAHILDTDNHGTQQPHLFAFQFDPSATYGDISKLDTLVFNWEFLNNTGSDASGQFVVDDLSSGSAALTRFGDLGNILNKQHTARGDFFLASSTTALDKDYVVSSKLNLPENVQSQDMVKVLGAEDQSAFTTESRPINYYFAFEKSMYQTISEEMINYFATMKDIHNLIGDPVERYRPEYKQMKHMRQRFFEKVGNDELDFDKFYEFYKWFDSSLSVMLGQLVPASADFSDNVKTVIESHVLERSKYRNIFPFLERKGGVAPEASVAPAASSYLPSDTGDEIRQRGLSNTDTSNAWNDYHAPQSGEDKIKWAKYREERAEANRQGIFNAVKQSYNRRIGSPVKLRTDIERVTAGVSKNSNYKPEFIFEATQPYGPVVPGSNIPKNITLTFDIDVEELVETTETFNPSAKFKLSYGTNPSINRTGSDDIDISGYGKTYGPFSLYSSSISDKSNKSVYDNFKQGVEITNLHHDFVGNTDASLQGPFAEKFVGGRAYRHTELNDGSDTRESRAEGFRLAIGLDTSSVNIPAGASGALGVVPPNYPFADSPAGSAPYGWLPELPTAQRFRDETAKRPVNIKNILMSTASVDVRLSGTIVHNQIGNYQKNYQVVQTSGRSINDPFFQDQSFSFAPNPETLATRGRAPLSVNSDPNVSGNLDFQLPDRTGANSNKTVFVNRFSAPGSYEVMSRGYLDTAHEELSVYNASPYRNLTVIDRGATDSDTDPSLTGSIVVSDQLGKPRGLNQLSTLHAGEFGHDSVFGSVPADTYVTVPSWHKTNRNRKRRLELSGTTVVTASVYDNLFVQHSIPRSAQNYSWISYSLESGSVVFNNDSVSPYAVSSYQTISASQVISADTLFLGTPVRLFGWVPTTAPTSSTALPTTFVGMTTNIKDPVSSSAHTLGFPSLEISPDPLGLAANYSVYPTFNGIPGTPGNTAILNAILLNRNGPYGYPTWKQIRTGETRVARQLRKENKIGYIPAPSNVESANGPQTPLRGNTFIDFTEAPIVINSSPITFVFEDNTEESNADNNIVVTVPFRNEIDYFSNEELNNAYGLTSDISRLKTYNTIVDFAISSSFSVAVTYTESLYPANINMFDDSVRRRTTYQITDIWDDVRTERGENGGRENSMGYTYTSSSIWPLDGHNITYVDAFPAPWGVQSDFSGTVSFGPMSASFYADGAGELMNDYSRYYVSGSQGISGAPPPAGDGITVTNVRPGATYASRVPAGSGSVRYLADPSVPIGSLYSASVFAGDAKWEAGEQAGKVPYQDYRTYSEKISLVGKDHSIVPEYRISELMETYIEDNESNFLAAIDDVFSLTGAALTSSAQDNFYKTYSNSDFLKYFSVVDEDLHGQRSGDLKIERDKVSLRCNAILKFLPYKGFYPAERTIELAHLLSQSYLPFAEVVADSGYEAAATRAFIEPLYAPGVLFNTIKSGIAVGNYVLTNTEVDAPDVRLSETIPTVDSVITELPEGSVQYREIINIAGNDPATNNNYFIQKIPFEAIQRPLLYLDGNALTGSGAFYDTGVSTYDQLISRTSEGTGVPGSDYIKLNPGKKLYELAIDNFLCETTEFFMDGVASLESGREDQFKPVTSGSVYSMKVELYRTLDSGSNVDRTTFDLYGRESAFGYPHGQGLSAAITSQSASFNHVVPSYYHGTGQATFTFTAPRTGVPTLDEILSNTVTSFAQDYPWTVEEDISQNIGDSVNLTDFYTQVPSGTVEQKKKWLIQSKFETPILNFADVSYTQPSASNVDTGISSSADIKINGMWHQYGSIPQGSNEGVFLRISEDVDTANDLADIVGFNTGIPVRVGKSKNANILEEAIIAIPFKTINNRRKFFPIAADHAEYETLQGLLKKYVFPPRFDFVINNTVDPILMYGFEFSQTITQQDITDIWQNLPPDISETFEQKETIIDDKEILDLLVNNSEDIQWMVFKVKKRAKKDFEKVRRQLVDDNVSSFTETVGDYSYNWPYDYFSLVELVKLDETVQYASADLLDEE